MRLDTTYFNMHSNQLPFDKRFMDNKNRLRAIDLLPNLFVVKRLMVIIRLLPGRPGLRH